MLNVTSVYNYGNVTDKNIVTSYKTIEEIEIIHLNLSKTQSNSNNCSTCKLN